MNGTWQRKTYADSTRDTLVLPDALLAILDLGDTVLLDLLHAHILLAATELGGINGDEETLHTALLGVLDVLPGDLAVAVDVQLDEEALAVALSVDDVVERAGGEGGDLQAGLSTYAGVL